MYTNLSSYLGEVPVFGGLGDGVRDVSAGGSEQHQLVGTTVHHVEERLHSYCSVALEDMKICKHSLHVPAGHAEFA